MIVSDLRVIGERLYKIRNKKGMSRLEVSEKADISDRTYADIERGTVNMRTETMLKICKALAITPNDIFVSDDNEQVTEEEIMNKIKNCSSSERVTALSLLSVYLKSLN